MTTVSLDIALAYIAQGFAPVPIAYREKKPLPSLREWQTLRIGAEDATRYFNGADQNIGVILGEASRGLVDIDLDCDEAVRAAPYLLAKTRCFGRESKRASHWLYFSDLSSERNQGLAAIQGADRQRRRESNLQDASRMPHRRRRRRRADRVSRLDAQRDRRGDRVGGCKRDRPRRRRPTVARLPNPRQRRDFGAAFPRRRRPTRSRADCRRFPRTVRLQRVQHAGRQADRRGALRRDGAAARQAPRYRPRSRGFGYRLRRRQARRRPAEAQGSLRRRSGEEMRGLARLQIQGRRGCQQTAAARRRPRRMCAPWLAAALSTIAGAPSRFSPTSCWRFAARPNSPTPLTFDEMMRAPILNRELPLVDGAARTTAGALPRPIQDTDVSQLQEWLQHAGLPKIGRGHRAPGRASERARARVSSDPRLLDGIRWDGTRAPRAMVDILSRRRTIALCRRDRPHVPHCDGGAHLRARVQGRLCHGARRTAGRAQVDGVLDPRRPTGSPTACRKSSTTKTSRSTCAANG